MQTCRGLKVAAETGVRRSTNTASSRPLNVQRLCQARSSLLVHKRTPVNLRKQYACKVTAKQSSDNGAQLVPAQRAAVSDKEGPSEDFKVIWGRLWKVGAHECATYLHKLQLVHAGAQLTLPYWTKSEDASKARWKLAGVVLLTLGTTGVRCGALIAQSLACLC